MCAAESIYLAMHSFVQAANGPYKLCVVFVDRYFLCAAARKSAIKGLTLFTDVDASSRGRSDALDARLPLPFSLMARAHARHKVIMTASTIAAPSICHGSARLDTRAAMISSTATIMCNPRPCLSSWRLWTLRGSFGTQALTVRRTHA